MIDNRLEYQRMYEVERKLWWYLHLHAKVLNQIKKHFATSWTDVRILDAACGTGGLLSFLRENGFENLTGFDYSKHALDFSRERGLDIEFGDLRDVDSFRPDDQFDVICCNDALYFLSDQEIITALKAFKKKLSANGLLIINIHAFEAFSGTHDLAVGSSRRFKLNDFVKYAKAAGLNIRFNTYWPFTLSLPILAVRQWQKFRIRKNGLTPAHTDSDVSYPGDFVNTLLRSITKIEGGLLLKAPFGSSLFMVLKR